MLPHDSQQLFQSGSAGALTDAAAYMRRSVCTDGAADGEDGDFSGTERQWAVFIEWAGSCGKILPLNFPPPEREGGREHDVTLDEASGRWIKYTKRSASGYTVSWRENGEPFLHNALPLDYLQRLLWQNDDIKSRGQLGDVYEQILTDLRSPAHAGGSGRAGGAPHFRIHITHFFHGREKGCSEVD